MEKISLDNLPNEAFVNIRVYLDKKYLLVSPDIPVTLAMKNRLHKWGFTSLMSSSNSPSSNGVPEVIKANKSEAVWVESLEERKRQKEASVYYDGCLSFLKRVIEGFFKEGLFSLSAVYEHVKEMKNQLRSNRKFILLPHKENITEDNYNISHSVNTAFLALCLAEALRLSAHRQIETGMAALLHRIGMLRLPPEIYMAKRSLTPQEKKTLTTYPFLSYQALKTSGFSRNILLAVMEHQERIDGSGYPKQLTGNEISLEGKILGVASAYSAIVTQRPHRGEVNGHLGMVEMLKGSGNIYDQAIIKALFLTLSLFPPGTYVELSDQYRGVVVNTDPKRPQHPIIQLLTDAQGSPLPDQPLFQSSEEDNGPQIKRPLTKGEQEKIEKLFDDHRGRYGSE